MVELFCSARLGRTFELPTKRRVKNDGDIEKLALSISKAFKNRESEAVSDSVALCF